MTPFIEGTFSNKFKGLDRYETSARPLGRLSRNLPSTIFYSRLLLGPLQYTSLSVAFGIIASALSLAGILLGFASWEEEDVCEP